MSQPQDQAVAVYTDTATACSHLARRRMRSCLASFLVAVFVLPLAGCDDPVPGAIGGLVFTVESIPSVEPDRTAVVERIVLTYNRVEAVHSTEMEGPSQKVVLDSQVRTVEFVNDDDEEFLVAQFQVPVGFVSQLRFFPVSVNVHLRDGRVAELLPDTPALPSWRRSGWKVVHEEGGQFEIREDELTGARGLLDFSDRLVAPSPGEPSPGGETGQAATGWKMKPTLPAQEFQVNPELDEPGVFADRMDIAFRPEVDRDRVDEINAVLSATVEIEPILVNWYRVKLPASTNLEDAFEYYNGLPEVFSALPAINYALFQLDADDQDDNLAHYDDVRLRFAWEHAFNATGMVGDHAVRVAVLDTGVDVTHPDLYRNIAINQAVLPLGLFDLNGDGVISPEEIAVFDCDPYPNPDGRITFRDLECTFWLILQGIEDPRPADFNMNDYPDGEDLLEDIRWTQENRVDPRTGLVNDLIGWNFADNNNRPFHVDPLFFWHGTAVSGIIAAEGNNALDVAGTVWRGSIIPVRTTTGPDLPSGVPAPVFANAVAYVEARQPDIANVSMGWNFRAKGTDIECGIHRQTTDIRRREFEEGEQNVLDQHAPLFQNDSEVLWVWPAGNSAYDLSNPGLTSLPRSAFQRLIGNRTLTVGGTETGTTTMWQSSSYGMRINGGEGVDIFAPATNWTVLDIVGGTRDDLRSGTSYAAPFVAGAAALLASVNPDFRGDGPAMRNAILDTADRVVVPACDTAPPDEQLLLNVEALIQLGLQP